MRIGLVLAALIGGAAQGQETQQLTVSAYNQIGDYLELIIKDTVAGQEINCVLFDSSGNPVKAQNWTTDNLATAVLVDTANITFASVACVYN